MSGPGSIAVIAAFRREPMSMRPRFTIGTLGLIACATVARQRQVGARATAGVAPHRSHSLPLPLPPWCARPPVFAGGGSELAPPYMLIASITVPATMKAARRRAMVTRSPRGRDRYRTVPCCAVGVPGRKCRAGGRAGELKRGGRSRRQDRPRCLYWTEILDAESIPRDSWSTPEDMVNTPRRTMRDAIRATRTRRCPGRRASQDAWEPKHRTGRE
jgi:hypothetical protein